MKSNALAKIITLIVATAVRNWIPGPATHKIAQCANDDSLNIETCQIDLTTTATPEAGAGQIWTSLLPHPVIAARDGRNWRNDNSAEVIKRTKARTGTTRIVADYEHQSNTGGVAPAAGWIEDLRVAAGEGR